MVNKLAHDPIESTDYADAFREHGVEVRRRISNAHRLHRDARSKLSM